jgi:5-methylcytosine-specific restriction endonuclease McrA
MMKLKYQHCRFCGDAVLGRTSHVDHIVPFKESRFGRNDPNGEDNLWVLCRSCHRKKTTIEMVLYREGRELYIEKLVELSGDLFVRKELEKAFEYCQLPS